MRRPGLLLRCVPVVLACGFGVACAGSESSVDGTAESNLPAPNGDPAAAPAAGSGERAADGGGATAPGGGIKTVFLIVMENHSWDTIKRSASAKYINGTLATQGAHAEQYFTPPGNHPSETNYLWLEAGDNLGVTNDDDPKKNHQSTTDHLVTQLEAAGVTWRSYVEDISGTECPLASSGLYGAKHTPQVFFDDVTDTNKPNARRCIEHVRPYSELVQDLAAGRVARYNFITPNLCHDMHGQVFGTQCNYLAGDTKLIGHGDTWLSQEVPKILASNAFQDNGVLFIVWDEGDESLGHEASDGPIPMFVLSPLAKKGYASSTRFTHSSMLRTIETIFHVPFLRGAKTSNDLSEMFTAFP